MSDIKKTIDDLQLLNTLCHGTVLDDAIELLKERDAVVPKVSCTEQRCGNCNKIIEMDGWVACPWCGKRIDWEGWWKKNGTHDNT